MTKKSARTDLAKQLRAAFVKSGLSRFALSKRSGVSYSVVHRFVAGDRDIKMETASRLCDVLGLELQQVRSMKANRKG